MLFLIAWIFKMSMYLFKKLKVIILEKKKIIENNDFPLIQLSVKSDKYRMRIYIVKLLNIKRRKV